MSPHPTPLFPCPPSSSYLLWDTLTSSVTFQTPDVTKQSWKLRCPEGKKEGNVGTWGGKTVGMGATKGAQKELEEGGKGGGGGGLAMAPTIRQRFDVCIALGVGAVRLSGVCRRNRGQIHSPTRSPLLSLCAPPPSKHSWDTPPL